MTKPSIQFSQFALTPTDKETAKSYSKYVRTQQRTLAPFVAGVCLLVTIVCLALAIRKGDFQKIGEKHASIYGFYFIIFLVLSVDVTVCWLISRVREIAGEFVLPVFGVLLFLLHLLNADTNKEVAPVTSDLKQVPFYTLMGSLYGLNAIVAIFCSSSYKVSVLSRLLIYANIIIIGVYRVRAGFNPVGQVILNFIVIFAAGESAFYIVNRERVKLFLMMESSKQQEQQTRQILTMVPANVLLVQDSKIIFQNKQVDKFVESFRDSNFNSSTRTNMETGFDSTQFFLNRQLFRLRLPSEIAQRKASIASNKDRISLSDIVAHDEFLAVSQQFEARSAQNEDRRIFTITKQPIILADANCSLLVIHEQTEFFQLETVREHNEGIRFANQCVIHQTMGPLKMIYEYVDILLAKMAKMNQISSDVSIFLHAIKSCSQKIQFNIYDLEAASQLTLEPIKIKTGQVNVANLINETLQMYQLQIEMKQLKVGTFVDFTVPELVETDPVRLQQVFSNLMSNATKFSNDQSTIEITCSFSLVDDKLLISVANEGLVIEVEEKKELFQRYKTLKAAKKIGAAGSGLGLYISRSLCQAMGGDIVLQSKIVNEDGEVKGLNEFIASIQVKPLTVETLNDNVDITQVTFQKIVNTKILIFEDQAFNLLALKEMMYFGLKLKNQTTFYSSGSAIAQAMQQFFKEKGENEVAIVIIDYNMPGMNGIELINWTRGYFKQKKVDPKNTPKFAFRAQQFNELPEETIREIFSLGIKQEDIIDQETMKQQLKAFFRRVDYPYRQLKDD